MRTTIWMDEWVPNGGMVMDCYGHVVGDVVKTVKVEDGWDVTIEVDDGTDIDRLQVLPRSGIVGSVNNR